MCSDSDSHHTTLPRRQLGILESPGTYDKKKEWEESQKKGAATRSRIRKLCNRHTLTFIPSSPPKFLRCHLRPLWGIPSGAWPHHLTRFCTCVGARLRGCAGCSTISSGLGLASTARILHGTVACGRGCLVRQYMT